MKEVIQEEKKEHDYVSPIGSPPIPDSKTAQHDLEEIESERSGTELQVAIKDCRMT